MMQLSDGGAILIRPIRPDDKAALVRGLSCLSDLSIQRRFLAPKRTFTSAELRYLTELDGHDHVAFVAEPADAPGRVIGVARYVRLKEDPHAAEPASVVADAWQRRGIGSLLADRLVEAAALHGVKRFTATMASDNVPAQRLMASLVSELKRQHLGSGVSELIADLAA